MGRDPIYTQTICDEAGIDVKHATGFYKEPFLPDIVYRSDENALSDFLMREILIGIRDSGIRANHIGEIGTGNNKISEIEEKIFMAAARAHVNTGVPICTHCTLGTMGHQQIDLLRRHGVELTKVVLSHLDLTDDFDYIVSVLDTGVNIAFDTIGKNNYRPDETRVDWLVDLCARGYDSQVLLSMDITRKSCCTKPGYLYLLTDFLPRLRERGLSDSCLENIMWNNSHRIYLN